MWDYIIFQALFSGFKIQYHKNHDKAPELALQSEQTFDLENNEHVIACERHWRILRKRNFLARFMSSKLFCNIYIRLHFQWKAGTSWAYAQSLNIKYLHRINWFQLNSRTLVAIEMNCTRISLAAEIKLSSSARPTTKQASYVNLFVKIKTLFLSYSLHTLQKKELSEFFHNLAVIKLNVDLQRTRCEERRERKRKVKHKFQALLTESRKLNSEKLQKALMASLKTSQVAVVSHTRFSSGLFGHLCQ